jgi:hypothetical protein
MKLLYPKQLGTSGSCVFEPLSNETLDPQTSLFKMTLKTQVSKAMEKYKNENPITKLHC